MARGPHVSPIGKPDRVLTWLPSLGEVGERRIVATRMRGVNKQYAVWVNAELDPLKPAAKPRTRTRARLRG